jgi:2-methylaconitate cis-trans-isomerase PrpF
MKKLIITAIFSSMLLLAGCTHSIHMVHTDGFTSGIPASSKVQVVEAQATQEVVFFFAFDTDYVDEAKAKLEQQCSGRISAVSTQYSTSHGFFHWTNKILMKGLCG